MAHNFKDKTHEIKRSLTRRARLRKAYYKMLGEDTRQSPAGKREVGENLDASVGSQLDLDAPDSEEEDVAVAERAAKKLHMKKSLEPAAISRKKSSKQKRQDAYHALKVREESKMKAERSRRHKKNVVTKRTATGQPKLGAQMNLLLQKIKESER